MPKTGSSSRGQLSAKEALTQSSDDGPFVPTVTAIATAPDLKWMVLSTDISSVGPCSGDKQKKTHTPQKKTHTPQKKTHTPQKKTQLKREPEAVPGFTVGRRKAQKEQLSPEEEERRRLRRERNKLAAAKCRDRRRQLTDSLQAETDSLEEEKAALEAEISGLMKEKEQLELLLMSHKPHCKIPTEMEGEEKKEEEEKEEKQVPDETTQKKSPLLHVTSALASSVNLEKMAPSPVPLQQEPVISGDSDVLLCSSAELEPYIDIKDVAMEELGSKMEYDDDDMDLLVPDIDLSASLGLSEWETLYMSMGGSLEPLTFDFSQGEECEGGKTKPAAENSTLLTL
ncbi:hypothetical protein QTP86_024992 [Hemibagrus guttatus]|nr:hypothetical protein QTP86_024992 [Hemibagrus guttatus]